jgi:hypothetical protein
MIAQDQKIDISVSDSKTYVPLPADVYQCEIIEVEQKEERGYQSEEMVTNIVFTFAVLEEGENYGRRLWAHCSPKLVGGAKTSKLYSLLSTLLDKAWTPEELNTFKTEITPDFLNSLVGSQIRLTVSQKPKQDGTMKNVIDGFLKKKKLMDAFDPEKGK